MGSANYTGHALASHQVVAVAAATDGDGHIAVAALIALGVGGDGARGMAGPPAAPAPTSSRSSSPVVASPTRSTVKPECAIAPHT